MARRGLNCTLSYADSRASRAFRVRCSSVAYDFEMVADESSGRRRKAYYPHRTAPGPFAITVDLIGRAERNAFNAYLMRYADYLLNPATDKVPQMTVQVPSRRFHRIGIPKTGIEFGATVGEMLWRPTITFETSGEPIDWDQPFRVSEVLAKTAVKNSRAVEFFYPTGTQLSGDSAAPGTEATSGFYGSLLGNIFQGVNPDPED